MRLTVCFSKLDTTLDEILARENLAGQLGKRHRAALMVKLNFQDSLRVIGFEVPRDQEAALTSALEDAGFTVNTTYDWEQAIRKTYYE